MTLNQLLHMVGGENAQAIQVGGPSGTCVGPGEFDRTIAFEDLPTGGAMMVFGQGRDLLEVVRQFAEFFAEEACGWCVPCRVGTTVLVKLLDKILSHRGTRSDLEQLESLAHTVGRTSRCGLGQTAPNPILSTLRSFPELWRNRLSSTEFVPAFELVKSLQTAKSLRIPLPMR
jgi:[NiFe] hydrogenase diaphorase moiety large subunit